MRRLKKALRKGRLPRRIDLVAWLEDHGYADTAGQAFKIISEERVKSDTHVLGFAINQRDVLDDDGNKIIENGKYRKQPYRVYERFVNAEFLPSIYVESDSQSD